MKHEIMGNIEKLEERFIAGEIPVGMFNKWQEKFKVARDLINRRSKRLVQDRQGRLKKMTEPLTYLTSVWDVYEKTSWEGRYVLISQIFSGGIQYADGVFRSGGLHPVFGHIKKEVEEKNLLFIDQTK